MPLGCPEISTNPARTLWPLAPVTYPSSTKVTVEKLEPPSLLIEATISVFKVVLAISSWNTTILLVLGAEPAVNAFDTIVVEVVAPVPVAVYNI